MAGAVTWQLPYELEGRLSFELERTLCPDDTADAGDATSDCGRYTDDRSRRAESGLS